VILSGVVGAIGQVGIVNAFGVAGGAADVLHTYQ
jgi:hypothetical protein